MQTIDQALKKLNTSKFRSSFYLTKRERLYIEEKGLDTVRSHAKDFVKSKLALAVQANDGKQTPMHGHPAFKAMHATACCCRGCLYKWYKVNPNRELSENEQERIVNLMMAWIHKQYDTKDGES